MIAAQKASQKATLVLCVILLVSYCATSRILLVPTAADASHIFTLRKVHDELKARGHDLTFVILPSDAAKLHARDGGSNISYIAHNGPDLDLADLVIDTAPKGFKPLLLAVWHTWHATCDSLLSDRAMMAQLKAADFDLIVGVWMFICTPMLSAKLGVPHVDINPNGLLHSSFSPLWRGSGRDTYMPARLSYIAELDMHAAHPMNFRQRMLNAYKYAASCWFDYRHMRPITRRLTRKHGVDLRSPEAKRRHLLTLYSADFALEQARLLPPKIKLVGHIMATPAKPLPPELEAFVAGAGPQGVVVISLGTNAQFAAGEMHAVAAALSRLPAHVVWKVTEAEVTRAGGLASLNLSANVKVLGWLPQNDLLAHPQTMAFLSHCGSNGLYEAAYHGVPTVCQPHFGDQEMNALKATSKGFGIYLLREEVTADAVHDALLRVLTDSSFRAAAQKVSRRMRSRKRTSVQEAADWVEHALETEGDPYLSLPEEDMPWVVSHSVDVLAAWLWIGLAAGTVACLAVRTALHRMQLIVLGKPKQL